MRTLILLLFFLLPGGEVPAQAEENLLSCDDYEYLTRDIDNLRWGPKIAAEVKIELINATDPKCFE